jgi:hypothetical protein
VAEQAATTAAPKQMAKQRLARGGIGEQRRRHGRRHDHSACCAIQHLLSPIGRNWKASVERRETELYFF